MLSNRTDNHGILQNFSEGKVPTAFPHNSPFNQLIKSSYGVRKSRNSKMGETRTKNNMNADMWKTSDGLFANGLGIPYGGRGELWKYSGTNHSDVTSKFATIQSVKSDWVTAETIDDGLKTKEVADAMLFLPTIFRKLAEYEKNLTAGIAADPNSIFTDAELSYLKSLPKDRELLKQMLFQVNEGRIKEKLEPLVIPSIGLPTGAVPGAPAVPPPLPSTLPPVPSAVVDDQLDEGKIRIFISSMVGDDEKTIDRKSTAFYKSIETDEAKLKQAFVLLGKIEPTVSSQDEKNIITNMILHITTLRQSLKKKTSPSSVSSVSSVSTSKGSKGTPPATPRRLIKQMTGPSSAGQRTYKDLFQVNKKDGSLVLNFTYPVSKEVSDLLKNMNKANLHEVLKGKRRVYDSDFFQLRGRINNFKQWFWKYVALTYQQKNKVQLNDSISLPTPGSKYPKMKFSTIKRNFGSGLRGNGYFDMVNFRWVK